MQSAARMRALKHLSSRTQAIPVSERSPTSVVPSMDQSSTSYTETGRQRSPERRRSSSDEQQTPRASVLSPQSSPELRRSNSDGEQTPRASVFSPQSLARSSKKRRSEKAAAMRAAKTKVHEDPPEETAGCSMDVDRSEEEHDDGSSSSDEEFDPQDIFDEWMVSLRLDQRQMLAVLLMESFKQRQKMRVTDAARESGSIAGFNKRTVSVTSSPTRAISAFDSRGGTSVTVSTTMRSLTSRLPHGYESMRSSKVSPT